MKGRRDAVNRVAGVERQELLDERSTGRGAQPGATRFGGGLAKTLLSGPPNGKPSIARAKAFSNVC